MINNIIAKDDYKLELHLKDGDIRIFNFKPYLNYEVFEELKDINNFKNFEVDELGGIDWLNGGSLSSDTLISESISIIAKEN